MRIAFKWLSRLIGAKRKRSSPQKIIRSASTTTNCVLKLASSSENHAILKVIFEQPQDQASRAQDSSRCSIGDSDDSFQSCISSISYELQKVAARETLLLRSLDPRASVGALNDLRIYAVTWNMNGKVPKSCLPNLLENGKGDYDLYVIGVQESPVSSLRRRLHPILGRHYNLVAKSVLGSLQLYVFGKSSLHVRGKNIDKVRFKGLGGVIGRQKGAVAASFCIGKSSFLFIASHFAAHEHNVNERNVQYLRARKKIFSAPGLKPCGGDTPCEGSPEPEFGRPSSASTSTSFVDESDVVVWLGDLNYRIEGGKGLVKSFLKLNLEKLLWKRDQLFNAVDQGQAFKGFVEGPLVFKPTYKYDPGTDNYDTSDKERVPSWTDRILIKTKDESPVNVDVENYYSIDGLKTSDHRPVKALLRVTNP